MILSKQHKGPEGQGQPDALARDWEAVRKSATGLFEDCTIMDRLMRTHVEVLPFETHDARGKSTRRIQYREQFHLQYCRQARGKLSGQVVLVLVNDCVSLDGPANVPLAQPIGYIDKVNV